MSAVMRVSMRGWYLSQALFAAKYFFHNWMKIPHIIVKSEISVAVYFLCRSYVDCMISLEVSLYSHINENIQYLTSFPENYFRRGNQEI